MYRINNNARVSVLFTLVISILLITTPIATTAEWSDNFTDKQLTDWELSSHGGGLEIDQYRWEVERGALVSEGPFFGVDDPRRFNVACRDNDVSRGHWYFDIYTAPSGIWGISLGKIFDQNADFQHSGLGWSDNTLSLIKYPNYMLFTYFHGLVNGNASGNSVGVKEVASLGIIDDWHTFILTRHNSTYYDVQIDSEVVYSHNLPEDRIPNTQQVCLFSLMGDRTKFDNVHGLNYNNVPPSFWDLNPTLFIAGVIVIAAAGILLGKGAYNRYGKKKRNLIVEPLPTHILDNISQGFNLTETSIGYLLFNQSQIDKKSEEEIRQAIPQDLIAHRYLLHPIRLIIMKLLFNEYQMPSADMKSILNISWGDFASHSKSLKEKGYIEVKDRFNEKGTKFQMVYLHERGREEFERLLKLLTKFVEKGSPFDKLLSEDESFTSDNLYPKS